MDEFTHRHLREWVQSTVPADDQEAVEKGIRAMVREYPELIEQGYSWPEIRRMAEAR